MGQGAVLIDIALDYRKIGIKMIEYIKGIIAMHCLQACYKIKSK